MDSLYESPIPGFKTLLEKTLSPEDQEFVEKLMANLTDEEIEVLMALVVRSEREASISLGMAWTTYWRRLQRGKAKAKVEVMLGTSPL